MSVLYSFFHHGKYISQCWKFDGTGFDLWKVRMESTLYLLGCAKALEENKSAGMDDATWKLLNRKAVAHIYIWVSDEVFGNIKGLTCGHEVLSKLKTMYESTIAVKQVLLMTSLIAVWLEDANGWTHFHIPWCTQSTSRCRIANLRRQDEGNLPHLQLNTFPHSMVYSINFKM
mgnify:CR=1 FL=1